jgi:cytochrome P450
MSCVCRMQVPTRQEVEGMVVSMACLQETLRKYSVVPLVTRIANRDTRLCGYDVPAGTKVALHLHGTHKMWQDHETYRPDRFLPGGEFYQFPEDIRRCDTTSLQPLH